MNVPHSSFQDFLRKKGIDCAAFQQGAAAIFQRCARDYEAAGPNMVEYGKKFFWNDMRKEFPIANRQLEEE